LIGNAPEKMGAVVQASFIKRYGPSDQATTT
jgi:hypothetical protein